MIRPDCSPEPGFENRSETGWTQTATTANRASALETPALPLFKYPGVCVWFTGLSGAGKSTTANRLAGLIHQKRRQVTLLDGDAVRTLLSKGLGFSKEDRDMNIRRMAFVAAEVVRHGGVVICAAVSPYRSTRQEVSRMIGKTHFLEIFVDTPVEICEQRDPKGIYAKFRRGEIQGLTGLDDPYELPLNPDFILETLSHPPDFNAQLILELLIARGYLPDE
ncbi:MAG: adenylyl-sulfate kinase [Terriglobia bacterium]